MTCATTVGHRSPTFPWEEFQTPSASPRSAPHAALQALGIPHVLIGGLAVNAHGYQHSTRGVDWLVPTHAAFDGDAVVTFKPGVPISVSGVQVDYLTPDAFPAYIQSRMEQVLTRAEGEGPMVVLPYDLLAFMKLTANRSKDRAAVVELIHAGMDVDAVRRALTAAGDAQIQHTFERCVVQAEEENK